MSATSNYLAFDLGASGGRAIVGALDGGKLSLSVIHRFPNGPVNVLGRYYWDALRLFEELKAGLAAYRQAFSCTLDGLGVDTWGVDYALLGRNDELLGNPRHYRDPRTEGMLDRAFGRVPREEIFQRTGIQFMEINTLYQLLAMRAQGDPTLDQATALLMMPDLFNYWLTGVKACEFSDATTTQMYDPRAGDWARGLLAQLDLPTSMLQPVIQPGTVLGRLHPALADECGLEPPTVIAPACHDTGSAVAAVPAAGGPYAYISSGTWSLMGVESPAPVITAESLAYNFTNEGGVLGTTRLLKNIMGLWLLQECRRTWASEGQDLSWDAITALAVAAPAFGPLVEPDAHDFLRPGDMPARIRAFCARTGQAEPATPGAIARCAMESLACKYRWVLDKLERMQGHRLETIHIVGGGCQNKLLCQLAADAAQRPVVAGPIEATAIGNVLMQALAQGRIAALSEGRQIVRASFQLDHYTPRNAAAWDEAYARWERVRAQTPEV
ncbi:MAG: rhamnulokinase family protein [Chloroflexota bacterium]